MSSDCKSPSAAAKSFSRPSVVESVRDFKSGNDFDDDDDDDVQTNRSTADISTSCQGKRKIPRMKKCSVEEKRIRGAAGECSGSSTKTSAYSSESSSSSSFVSEEMIGQPRLAYPISAPKKTKTGDATVFPSIHGLYPTFPMALAAGQQGGALSPFGLGTMPSTWDSTALAKLQIMQMNEMIKNYISAMSLSGLLPPTTLLPTPGTMMSSKKMQDLTSSSSSSSSSFVSSSSSPNDNSTHLGVGAKSTAAAPEEKSETFLDFTGSRNDPVESGGGQQDSVTSQATDGRRGAATTDESSELDDEIRPLHRSTDCATIGVGEGKSEFGGSHQGSSCGGGLNYLERRRKNNDSARRSRDARRTRIDETVRRVAYLEHENLQMRAMIDAERDYLVRLHRDLVQRKKNAIDHLDDDSINKNLLGRGTTTTTTVSAGPEGREEGHVSSTEAETAGETEAIEAAGGGQDGGRQILEKLSCANPQLS